MRGESAIEAKTMAVNIAASAAAGLLWYLQFFFYSMGQTKMGRYDFSELDAAHGWDNSVRDLVGRCAA